MANKKEVTVQEIEMTAALAAVVVTKMGRRGQT